MSEVYELPGTGAIPLKRRDGSVSAYTYVDLDDFKRFGKLRWGMSKGYALRWSRLGGRSAPLKRVSLAREVLGLADDDKREPDHIDRDKLNNRRSNLRIVTQAENKQNRRSFRGSSSQYRGVSRYRDGMRWVATCRVDGKTKHLGIFDDELKAAEAAAACRRQHMPGSTD